MTASDVAKRLAMAPDEQVWVPPTGFQAACPGAFALVPGLHGG